MAGKKMPRTQVQEEKNDSGDVMELMEHRAMVYMPENAVEVTLHAKVFHDGALYTVSKIMTMEDIREAFRKADDGYIDEEDTFVITDKGKAYLDELEAGRCV